MFKFFKMEEANDGTSGGSGGGGAAPNIADGGNANAGAGGNSGGGQGNSGAANQSWLDSLPDDIKKDPSLSMFKEPAALAKSWVNAQKMIGADKVVMPNDKSTEEEWNAFYQKLGRPESHDKYDIKLPEGQKLDEGFAKGFKEAAFKSGLSPKQVSALAEWYTGVEKSAVEGQQTAQINQLRDNLKAYADKLGGEEKYKAKVDSARVAVNALANPELKEYLKTSGLGSRPEMIEFFAELKNMMSEDKIRDGTGVSFQKDDPAEIQSKIEEIEKKLFSDLNSSSKSAWLDQRNKLYERLNAARQQSA